MDLTLSDEQRLLRESVDRFIDETYDADHRRRMASDPLGFSAAIWKQFAELGWLALPIPEAYGGLGGGAIEIGILMEAFGRGLVAEPYLSTVVIGAGADLGMRHRGAEAGDVAQDRRRLALPGVRAFGAQGALRSGRGGNHGEEDAGRLAARWPQDRGARRRMPRASSSSRRASPSGNGAPGKTEPVPGAIRCTRPHLARFSRGSAAAAPAISICRMFVFPPMPCSATAADALPAIEAVVDRAMAALGAEAVGIMQTLLDTTLEYTKIRKQFGRPLSANQVIRHRLADMAMQCDEARSMALRAALMANADPVARSRAASGAKAKIGKCARFVAEQSVQLHGAMGVTEELDIGSYFKRLLAFDTLFGGSAHHYRRHAALGGRAMT